MGWGVYQLLRLNLVDHFFTSFAVPSLAAAFPRYAVDLVLTLAGSTHRPTQSCRCRWPCDLVGRVLFSLVESSWSLVRLVEHRV